MADISPAQFKELADYLGLQWKSDAPTVEFTREALAQVQAKAPLAVKATIAALLQGDTYERASELVIEDPHGIVNDSYLTRADLNMGATGAPIPKQQGTMAGRLASNVASIPSAATDWFWGKLGYTNNKVDAVHMSIQEASAATGSVQTSFKEVGSAIDQLATATGKSNDALLTFERQVEGRMNTCETAVQNLDRAINDIESSSEALFQQWGTELNFYSDPKVREDDRQKLVATRAAYKDMLEKIRQRRATIDEPLFKLRDNVLWLRHQVDATALNQWIADKGKSLQADTESLTQTMTSAMADINKFLADSGKTPLPR